jgi:hypothetical protein
MKTKEEIKKLKAEEPWEYDALYDDPVTGSDGFAEVFFITLIALGVWGIVNYLLNEI